MAIRSQDPSGTDELSFGGALVPQPELQTFAGKNLGEHGDLQKIQGIWWDPVVIFSFVFLGSTSSTPQISSSRVKYV